MQIEVVTRLPSAVDDLINTINGTFAIGFQKELTVNSSQGCIVIDLCIRLPHYRIVNLQQVLHTHAYI